MCKCKCLPGFECVPVNNSNSTYLYFTANRFLVKLFKSSSTGLISECMDNVVPFSWPAKWPRTEKINLLCKLESAGIFWITSVYVRSYNLLFSVLIYAAFVMVAVWNRTDHYIFALSFLLSFFFLFSSPNLSGRRLDVCHTSTHGVALVRI